MACADHVANGEETLLADREFSQILLRRYFSLEEVANFSLVETLESFFTAAQLHLIEGIAFIWRLDLNHLNTIKENDGDWDCFTPTVVHGCHAKLHSQCSNSSHGLIALKLLQLGQSGVDLIGVIAIDWLELAVLVGVGIKDRGLDRQVFEIVNGFVLLDASLGRMLSSLG